MFTALISVLVLGVLILVHEAGHFLVAKFFSIGVQEFSIGFGTKLLRKRIGETLYAIRLVPLGGFVRMVGDDPRQVYGSETPAAGEESGEEENNPALLADRSRWFLNKAPWVKAAVVFAGPLANLLFALFVSFVAFYVHGKASAVNEPIIGDVFPDYPAEKAGLRSGDRVLSVEGQAVDTWDRMARLIADSAGRPLRLEVEQKDPATGEIQRRELTVQGREEDAEIAIIEGTDGKRKSFKIGIVPSITKESVGALEAAELGAVHIWFTCKITLRGLYGMLRGAISPKHIGGPIIILREAARSVKKGWEKVLDFMVFLSVSLAILNLLPIPILDGGHLMFFFIEWLKGSPVSLRVQEFANQVGIVVLLALMVFALGNDLMHVFRL